MRIFAISVMLAMALLTALAGAIGQREAEAVPALQLPWPTGVGHGINGGTTYGCGPYHVDSSEYAIDFNLTTWEDVSATAAGQVIYRRDSGDARGIFIEIEHEGSYRTRYLHLTTWAGGIQEGGWVTQGQLIGYAGGTGGFAPHLHFDMKYYDQYGSPHAHRAEPMSGISGFGYYGFSAENSGQCADNPNDPSPLWTSQPPVTPTPSPSPTPACNDPGPPANGSLYREFSSSSVYITYDNVKYWFHSEADLFAMGYGWEDVRCVPDGYFAAHGVGDIPANKTVLQNFGSTQRYVVKCGPGAEAAVELPITQGEFDELVADGAAISPELVVPPGEASELGTVPEWYCHMREVGTTENWIVCKDPASGNGYAWEVPNFVDDETGENLLLLRWGFGPSTEQVVPAGVTLPWYDYAGELNDHCLDTDQDLVAGKRYSDLSETFLPTVFYRKCPLDTRANNENPDPWPPDFDDNRTVNIFDLSQMTPPVYGSIIGEDDYNPRMDLLVDGVINIFDMNRVQPPVFGSTCTP